MLKEFEKNIKKKNVDKKEEKTLNEN